MHLKKIEDEIKELSSGCADIKNNVRDSMEFKHVLQNGRLFFNDHNQDNVQKAVTSDASEYSAGHLHFIAGVVSRDRLASFERMLWRICRGNIYFKSFDIETPLENLDNVSIVM